MIANGSTGRELALVALSAAMLPGLAFAAEVAARLPARSISELQALATLKLGETAAWIVIADEAVWVGSTGPHAVHRIDPVTNQVVAVVQLPGEPCAGPATGFGFLWVPLCTSPASLAKVDLQRNALTEVFKVGALAEGGVATSSDSVWLVKDEQGSLARIDPQSGALRQTIQLPPGSFNPLHKGGLVWTTRAAGAEVTAVDTMTNSVVATAKTGPNPRFLTASTDTVWTLNQGDGTLTRIDARKKQALKTIPLGTPGRGGDDDHVTPTEKAALYDAYVAYFGTYTVDASRGIVIHHVAGDLADVFVGNDEERPYELKDNRLTLRPRWTSDGKQWEGIRVFKRAE